jgi:predicted site-specific integrase-resolvase
MRNGQDSEFIRVSKIQKTYDISDTKLREWANKGLVKFVKTPGGNRLYHSRDLSRLFGNQVKKEKRCICYCRVSSQKQKEDLVRQREFIQERCPGQEIISDIGSGINFKKKGIQKLINLVLNDEIETITISDKDRLCRFGYELLEQICQHFGTKILVLHAPKQPDCERELADDLLTICNVFVAKKNGKRAARNKRERIQEASQRKTKSTSA